MLDNIKNRLLALFYAACEKYVPRYPVAFEYRFNRRLALNTMIGRLCIVALRTPLCRIVS